MTTEAAWAMRAFTLADTQAVDALVQTCIDRALRDGAPLLALHTSTVMVDAQHLCRRMGFEVVADLPPMAGVPYVMMHKRLV